MKLKTSCYDCATGRMELRRFAPVWILYTLALALLTGMAFSGNREELVYQLQAVNAYAYGMPVLNFIYALIMAQLLFGDLYTPRLCYAIHSLPITRGGWFGTQVILGIMGSLVPNLLGAAVIYALVDGYRIVALWWLIHTDLQFLLFFGTAALCAICAGNRFGMLILYGMIHFADAVCGWLYKKLYASLIYGMYIPKIEVRFSPVVSLNTERLYEIETSTIPDSINPNIDRVRVDAVVLNTPLLLQTAFWAVVGCAAIWLAMRLYRKRKLECAGDLLAFPKMELPFLVLFAVGAGGLSHFFASTFGGGGMTYSLLATGLVLGYFAALMLLKRQIHVFHVKNLIPLGMICGVFLLSVVLTGLDVLEITYRMPKAEDIESVTMGSLYSGRGVFDVTDRETIEDLLVAHEAALEEHRETEAGRPLLKRIFGNEGIQPEYYDDDGNYLMSGIFSFSYKMKNGSEMKRIYFYPETTPAAPQLRSILSDSRIVFADYYDEVKSDSGDAPENLEFLLNSMQYIQIDCMHDLNSHGMYNTLFIEKEADMKAMVNALLQDCEAGTASQHSFLHPDRRAHDYLQICYQVPNRRWPNSLSLSIFPEMENTYRWLIDSGYHTENLEPSEDEFAEFAEAVLY